ncbi:MULTISPECIES: hypothetical protein [unclassified Microbacterium]|uniref:hypothetical protein n=1 Tax=unclassified Microbacterium TaxID=2609290 RepID=UPI00365E3412
MTDPTDSPEHTSRYLQRRTLVKGAAWSIPVIAAAAALPGAAASPQPVRNLSASSRVSVPPAGDPTWNTTQYGVGKKLIPYSPVTLGLSFTNLGDPLAAGEVYIQGLLTSAAKNAAGNDLFTLSASANNGWVVAGIGTPQHAGPTVDAAYPVWFRYMGALATGQTAPTVFFTANPTGAIADRIIVNGTVLIPGQILYSKPFINADLSAIPPGKAAAPADFTGTWSNTPLPGVTDQFYIEPSSV